MNKLLRLDKHPLAREEAWKLRSCPKYDTGFFVIKDGRVISSCIVHFSYSADPTPMVINVQTREAYQHQGYATTMLQALIAWTLTKPKIQTLVLYHSSHPAARPLYLRAGFQDAGLHGYMTLDLAALRLSRMPDKVPVS